MNKLWVIAKTTFTKNVKSWGYWGLVASPLIFLAVMIGINLFAQNAENSNAEVELAVINSEIPIAESFVDSSISIREDFSDLEEAKQALDKDEVQGIVDISVTDEGLLDIQVIENGEFSSMAKSEFEKVLNNLQPFFFAQSLNLSPEEIGKMFQPPAVQYEPLHVSDADGAGGADGEMDKFIHVGLATLVNFIAFFLSIYYAQLIVNEIAQDKGSRMMEIILSSTHAKNHFLGKILGMLMLILLHLGIYIVIGGGAYLYFKDHEILQIGISFLSEVDGLGVFMGYMLIFLILAILMYVMIAGFIGSLVTKTEDAANAIAPVSMLTVIGFYLGFFGALNTENIFIEIGSFIPFFTPFVMPFRMAKDTVTNWEVWSSIGLTTLFLVLFTWISVKLYRVNALTYSDNGMIATMKRAWSLKQSEQAD